MNRIRRQNTCLKIVLLLTRTIAKSQQDRCIEMGAALAYYATFALFPLLLVGLSVIGFLLGPDTNVFSQILIFGENVLPSEAFEIVKSTLIQLNQTSLSAGITGFGLLVFMASGIFGALSSSLDVIWKSTPAHAVNPRWHTGLWAMLRRRIFGIILVFLTAALMIASLFFNVAVRVGFNLLQSLDQQLTHIQLELNQVFLLDTIEQISLFLVLMFVVMMLFKALPSTKVMWGDVWLGALLTTSLFMGLQYLIGSSVIQIGSRFHSYGVLGGLMVLMFWLYLTCQLFFLGSSLTYVYAYLFGSRCRYRK